MTTFITLQSSTYERLLQDKKLFPDPLAAHYMRFEGASWLCREYERSNGVQTLGLFYGMEFNGDLDQLASCYMADSEWVLIELDVPESECLMLHSMSEHCLASSWPSFFTEIDSKIFDDYWENEFSKLNTTTHKAIHQMPDLDPYDELNQMVRLYRCDVTRTWSKLLDTVKPKEYSEHWCGKFRLTPYFHVVRSDWIVKAEHFSGTDWAKWVGPNKVDAETYPPITGYGDTIKIGERFTATHTGFTKKEILTLVGWEEDRKMVIVYAINEADRSYTSFAMNPICGTIRTLTKEN